MKDEDVNYPVVTPMSELLEERQNENLKSVSATLTTVINHMPTPYCYEDGIHPEVIEHRNTTTSDDSAADPLSVSEISNLKSLSPENIAWPSEIEIVEQPIDQKKGLRKSNNWQRAKNKQQRMMGEEYVGFKKVGIKYVQNELKSARTIGPICMSKRCFSGKVMYCSKLTEEDRYEIFEAFWKMSWQEKKMYISSMVDTNCTKRKTTGSNSRRTDSKIYHLKVDDKKERVCLKTFLETLGIKEWTVRYWLGEKTNAIVSETSDNQVEERRTIKKYLTALPKLPSQYCRHSTSKLYLEPIIQTKSQLYRLYVDYSIARNEPVGSKSLFEDLLIEENIELFQPTKDACDQCCVNQAVPTMDAMPESACHVKEEVYDEDSGIFVCPELDAFFDEYERTHPEEAENSKGTSIDNISEDVCTSSDVNVEPGTSYSDIWIKEEVMLDDDESYPCSPPPVKQKNAVKKCKKQNIKLPTDRFNECSICKKKFERKYSLRRHYRTHFEKANECQICHKILLSPVALRMHSRVHTGEKPFSCKICEKTFSQTGHLTVHLRIHSGDKSFKCKVCNKIFRTASVLRRHSKVHNGERNHDCSICKKNFSRADTLKNHLKIHTNNKSYECAKCLKMFNYMCNLRKHMVSHF